MATKKKEAAEVEALGPDDPRAGTVDDPAVEDPYAHLRREGGAPDQYRHATSLDAVHEAAEAAASSSSEDAGDDA